MPGSKVGRLVSLIDEGKREDICADDVLVLATKYGSRSIPITTGLATDYDDYYYQVQ